MRRYWSFIGIKFDQNSIMGTILLTLLYSLISYIFFIGSTGTQVGTEITFSAYSDVEVKGNGQEEWTLQIGGYRPFEYDSPSGPKSAVAHSADFPWKRAYVYISEPMTYTGDIIIEAVGSSHGEFYISSAAPVTATQGLTDSDLRDFLRATMFVVGGWFLWILTNHVLLSLKN